MKVQETNLMSDENYQHSEETEETKTLWVVSLLAVAALFSLGIGVYSNQVASLDDAFETPKLPLKES